MNARALLPVFAATLFLSAFLIFAVQPMASKMLLPLLGGSPSVWNTAMVFFQAMLLGGYAYAHFIARVLPLKFQALLHIVLLCAFTVVLPLSIPPDATPPDGGGQELWQLGIMLTCIGGPFFILAASAPLFQHWFASSGHKDAANPYFLYAVSNAGSMIALLGYPFIFEPLLTLSQQTGGWFKLYIALIVLVAACGYLVRSGTKPAIIANDSTRITWTSRFTWILLAFIPSSLMLGVTTMITTDIASVPLFWIIPLTIYLATFIIAFSNKPVNVPILRQITAYILCVIIFLFMLGGFMTLKIPAIILHLMAFFACALLCHGELAQSKPSASHLTEYFLIISFGGVLGGIFNALIAPQIFPTPLEYSISLALVAFVIWAGPIKFAVIDGFRRSNNCFVRNSVIVIVGVTLCVLTYMLDTKFMQAIGTLYILGFLLVTVKRRGPFVFVCFVAMMCFQSPSWSTNKELIARDRNYFGVIKVFEKQNAHFLFHGTTLHGAQWQTEKDKHTAVTYYNPKGPVPDVFDELSKRKGTQQVGAIGLGVGSIACYSAPGRHFDFYEIDEDVVRYAEDPKYFSYLSGCKSPYSIILGDGRLKIAKQPDGKYDLIFLDAFSSDNIPIHLLTKEAFALYLSKLAPDGLIAINISNRYLDLKPVITAISKDLGFAVRFKNSQPATTKGDVSELFAGSIFAVIAKEPKTLAAFDEDSKWKTLDKDVTMRPWTDDYANILSSFFILQ